MYLEPGATAPSKPAGKTLPGTPPPTPTPGTYSYQLPAIHWPMTTPAPTPPPPPPDQRGDTWMYEAPTPPAEVAALQSYANVLQQSNYTPAAQQYLAGLPLHYQPVGVPADPTGSSSGQFVPERGGPGAMWLNSASDQPTAVHELGHAWDWKQDITDIDPLMQTLHRLTRLFGDRLSNFNDDASLMRPQFPQSLQNFPGMFGNAQPGWGGPSEFYAVAGEQPRYIPSGLQQYYSQYNPSAFQP